jgi:hypothetical protein
MTSKFDGLVTLLVETGIPKDTLSVAVVCQEPLTQESMDLLGKMCKAHGYDKVVTIGVDKSADITVLSATQVRLLLNMALRSMSDEDIQVLVCNVHSEKSIDPLLIYRTNSDGVQIVGITRGGKAIEGEGA